MYACCLPGVFLSFVHENLLSQPKDYIGIFFGWFARLLVSLLAARSIFVLHSFLSFFCACCWLAWCGSSGFVYSFSFRHGWLRWNLKTERID